MENKKYSIGLDIGTSSIGFAGIDVNGKLVRAKGKNIYGVNLFETANTAEERRLHRGTRRRINRRKWRLKLLREIFEPYISPLDSSFFIRLSESNLSSKDPNKKYSGELLFNDQNHKDFYEKNPTIFHLRNALMSENRKFDIREIYLAIHHIVKYRGNFLDQTNPKMFKVSTIDLGVHINHINEFYQNVFPDNPVELREDKQQQIKKILLDENMSNLDKKMNSLK